MNVQDILAENIRRYRIIRGFDQAQIAERANISRVSYGKIETGKTMPRDAMLETLAGILNVSLFDLFRPDPKPRAVLFRTHKAETVREEVSQELTKIASIRWLENYSFLQEVTKSPPPDVKLSSQLRKEEAEALEAFAERVRRTLLGSEYPVDDLPQILESYGVKVRLVPFLTPKCFGFNFGEADGVPAIFVNTGFDIPKERQLFSLVHELGHLLLHSTDGDEKGNGDKQEEEANQFAAAFLIPCNAFHACWNARGDMLWFDRVLAVKRIFKVSYMTVLHILGNGGKKKIVYTWFRQGYKKRFGRDLSATVEPCPAEIVFGTGNYVILARKAFESEAITESRLAELLEETHAQIRERIKDWSLSTL